MKYLSLLLAAVLLCVMITACGQNSNSDDPSQPEQETVEATDAAPDETSPPATEFHPETPQVIPDYVVRIGKIECGGFFDTAEADVSYTGYHYAHNDGWSVDMDGVVLRGSFSYDKKFTDKDLSSFSHGGSVTKDDSAGDVESEFFSHYSPSEFAVRLPDQLSAGKYTAKVTQHIAGKDAAITICFTVYPACKITSYEEAYDFRAWDQIGAYVQFAGATVRYDDDLDNYVLVFSDEAKGDFIYEIKKNDDFTPSDYRGFTISGQAEVVEKGIDETSVAVAMRIIGIN